MRASPLAREALLSAVGAAVVAAILVWLGPPGTDFAAHAYQRSVFLHHGFALWNNFWYAGRYSFVTYSLLYYPLAALFGIKLLAVATIATAALAFAVVIGREWGPLARWSSRSFAVMWAGVVLSAAFPFALGAALALFAIWALQARARGRFAVFALLTLAASPLAFALLVIVLAAVAIGRRARPADLLVPGAVVVIVAALEVVAWRLFPDEGRYPFTVWSLLGILAFCLIGAGVTWNVEAARIVRWLFLAYLAVCVVVFLVPSQIGANIMRLREAAVPVAVLALSLRRWRPLGLCLPVLALALAWSIPDHVIEIVRNEGDPASQRAYWRPAVSFLRAHLTPSYRVEAVDTAGHWAAVYLPREGVPLVRGWFRQDDYPANRVLYDPLRPRGYRQWLRRLGVRYVVLTNAPPDYSARDEARLLASGRAGLPLVFAERGISIYSVPRPRPIVTGAAPAKVTHLRAESIGLQLSAAGRYRLAVRWSPYWTAPDGVCLSEGHDEMLRLSASRPGRVTLRFGVSGAGALAAFTGSDSHDCS